jgi:hypothetical protein
MRARPITITREKAEQIAIVALNYLAADPARLGGFLAATGIGPQNLRSSARDPAFLAGVLAHLVQDEALMLAFADDVDVPPEEVAAADRLLSPPAMDGSP